MSPELEIREPSLDERCPLFDVVSTLDGPRSRKELARLVVKWITGWGEDDWDADIENVPGDLFRDDEVEVALSLTSFEFAIAAALIFGEAADFIERRDGPGEQADSLRHTGAFLARGILPYLRSSRSSQGSNRPHRCQARRRAPRSRRARSSQRARSPGRRSADDPHKPDDLGSAEAVS